MVKKTSIFKLIPILLLLAIYSCEPEDTSPPEVKIVNPLEDLTVYNRDTVIIHIEASDNEKVKEMNLLLDNQIIFRSDSKPYLYSLNCEGLDGNHIIQATAIDASGNIGEYPLEIIFSCSSTLT